MLINSKTNKQTKDPNWWHWKITVVEILSLCWVTSYQHDITESGDGKRCAQLALSASWFQHTTGPICEKIIYNRLGNS